MQLVLALFCCTVVAVSELNESFEEVEKGQEISFSWETSTLEVQTYGTENLDKTSHIELEFGLDRQSDRRVLKISNLILNSYGWRNSKAKIEYEEDSEEYLIPISISRVRWTFRKDENLSVIRVDCAGNQAASFPINDEDKINRFWFGPKDTASEYYQVIYFNGRGKIEINCSYSNCVL